LQDGLKVPGPLPYLIRSDHAELLRYTDSRVQVGDSLNILVKGPQGCGKSALPQAYANTRNRPLATLEIGMLSEAAQVFGRVDLVDGNTIYIPGLFTEAIQTPGAVVHLQELNRPESDKSLNAIFSVLDDQQRSVWVDEAGRYIQVAKGVTFFATLNAGFEFIGTMPVDSALEDRFHIKIELGYLPFETEINLLIMRTLIKPNDAENVVAVANGLRNNGQDPIHVSIRNTLEIARMMKFGLTLPTALRAVIALDDDKMETVLLTLQNAGIQVGSLSSDSYKLLSR